MIFKYLLFVLLLLGCSHQDITKPVVSPPKPEIKNTVKSEKVDWIESSLDTVPTNGKINFIYFYDKSCKWCEEMQKHTLTNECVIKELNKNFNAIRVDYDKHPENVKKIFAAVPAYEGELNPTVQLPAVAFILSDGTLVPYIITGYVPAFRLCPILLKASYYLME